MRRQREGRGEAERIREEVEKQCGERVQEGKAVYKTMMYTEKEKKDVKEEKEEKRVQER